jgi:hypothetical protein
MQWTQGMDKYSAWAKTPFASLRIGPDFAHSSAEAIRLQARVETLNGAGLAATDDLPSLDAAQAWCVEQYRALLEAELRSL